MKSISCKDAVHFILKKEEGKLSLWERLRLWRHLTICSLCRIFSKQSKLINHSMNHRQATHFTLTAEEKERIIRNVLNEKEN